MPRPSSYPCANALYPELALAKIANAAYNLKMGTKNISFTRQHEAYINAKVAAGEYVHASEVVRDAIRALMQHEADKLEWLREAIDEGVAAADRGEAMPADQAIATIKARGRTRQKNRKVAP